MLTDVFVCESDSQTKTSVAAADQSTWLCKPKCLLINLILLTIALLLCPVDLLTLSRPIDSSRVRGVADDETSEGFSRNTTDGTSFSRFGLVFPCQAPGRPLLRAIAGVFARHSLLSMGGDPIKQVAHNALRRADFYRSRRS